MPGGSATVSDLSSSTSKWLQSSLVHAILLFFSAESGRSEFCTRWGLGHLAAEEKVPAAKKKLGCWQLLSPGPGILGCQTVICENCSVKLLGAVPVSLTGPRFARGCSTVNLAEIIRAV